jgi:MFS family permease
VNTQQLFIIHRKQITVLIKMKSETVTLVLVNLAGIMERADESLLPGVYKEVGAALNADPTALGSLTLFRSLVQSLCYPLAAYLATHHNRAHVIALGAFLWAAATFLVAISSTFLQVLTSIYSLLSFFCWFNSSSFSLRIALNSNCI